MSGAVGSLPLDPVSGIPMTLLSSGRARVRRNTFNEAMFAVVEVVARHIGVRATVGGRAKELVVSEHRRGPGRQVQVLDGRGGGRRGVHESVQRQYGGHDVVDVDSHVRRHKHSVRDQLDRQLDDGLGRASALFVDHKVAEPIEGTVGAHRVRIAIGHRCDVREVANIAGGLRDGSSADQQGAVLGEGRDNVQQVTGHGLCVAADQRDDYLSAEHTQIARIVRRGRFLKHTVGWCLNILGSLPTEYGTVSHEHDIENLSIR
mmetsp:Transcript_15901/g.40684  ORF Transcript_15901/g.40684 Transcript_15901/m.40684 type:complete len:261 (-) Transcript_15901:1350-2132(-)